MVNNYSLWISLGFDGLQALSQEVNWIKIELQTEICIPYFWINEKYLIQKLNTSTLKHFFKLHVNFWTTSLFDIFYTETKKKQIPEPFIFLSVQKNFPFLFY